ncbi:hypothetical protein EDD37DRAFT_615984 [Exophiala viscosa]|uniref:uncharacterized protein n=1 Tax=Exophiala viscosa TaxID=2486360 RepID=UPI002192A5AD|nr:hypothetical protein EDD37DRAFT_615984 [Exophiala viscosa]
MPRVKPGQRKRSYAPKTRSGCLTCKLVIIRKVKCDESKPDCDRCLSTGRRCDGYETEQRSQDGLVLYKPQTISRPPSFSILSAQESRSFQYFYEQTSSQLSGFHGCDFWSGTVLQLASEDEAVRHGVVALASLHENFGVGRVNGGDSEHFALKQYNLAIRRHMNQLESPKSQAGIECHLAACLIFISIEIIRGHFASSLSLLKKSFGVFEELLRNRKYLQKTASNDLLKTFGSQLNRLESQAVGLVGAKAWGTPYASRIRGPPPKLPKAFSSAAEARDYFEYYANAFILGSGTSSGPANVAPMDNDIQQGDLRAQLYIFNHWSNGLDDLIGRSNNMPANERAALGVLQIERLILTTSLDVITQRTSVDLQVMWDKYTDTFAQIVNLAQSILEMVEPSNDKAPASRKPYFTLDLGLVGPLYDIARRCRDPQIRRRAIGLLYAYPRQEGMFDGVLAARVAERVVEIEEASLGSVTSCADVPDWARLSDVHPVFDLEKKRAVLFYQRQLSALDVGRIPVQETIEWN